MRALVLSNMRPERAAPGRGSFVRDQVAALRTLPDLDVELHEFPPGRGALLAAAGDLARRPERYDIVHAHFGLTALPALAVRARRRVLTVHGTDVRHPLTGRLTRLLAGRMDLTAAVSASLAAELPQAGAVLPCGVDLERFAPRSRAGARERLGLPAGRRVLLFPADPARAVKRHDRARAVAERAGAQLLHAGTVDPREMPELVAATDAVLVPSDAEGFGLAVLEALACGVAVLATPVGVHPLVLDGLPGALCAPFDAAAWAAALPAIVDAASDPSPARARAALFDSRTMAERVALAWRELLAVSG